MLALEDLDWIGRRDNYDENPGFEEKAMPEKSARTLAWANQSSLDLLDCGRATAKIAVLSADYFQSREKQKIFLTAPYPFRGCFKGRGQCQMKSLGVV
ncbi:hypothetical protein [Sphaerothrix gracilis]|uniref:hypothetical protein n=1 Tax=Sphaerothrix gracilis TaxID=3151835 RepID=UPI0031FC90BE